MFVKLRYVGRVSTEEAKEDTYKEYEDKIMEVVIKADLFESLNVNELLVAFDENEKTSYPQNKETYDYNCNRLLYD